MCASHNFIFGVLLPNRPVKFGFFVHTEFFVKRTMLGNRDMRQYDMWGFDRSSPFPCHVDALSSFNAECVTCWVASKLVMPVLLEISWVGMVHQTRPELA